MEVTIDGNDKNTWESARKLRDEEKIAGI